MPRQASAWLGQQRKRDEMQAVHTKERELEREISEQVEGRLPGTEVLAVELLGPERFCVYVDNP
jgi:hypothetical protein